MLYFMTSSYNELHDTGLICQDAIKTLKVLGPCSMFIFKFSVSKMQFSMDMVLAFATQKLPYLCS